MKKLLLLPLALLVLTLPYAFTPKDHQFGTPVSAQEAEQIHAACPGTLFATVPACFVPCISWGSGTNIQTLSVGFGSGALVSFDCGCGGWFDTWTYLSCAPGG